MEAPRPKGEELLEIAFMLTIIVALIYFLTVVLP